MIVPTEIKFPPLEFTSNNLVDVINLIKAENIVALYTSTACRVFHAIFSVQPDSPVGVDTLKDHRVIYLDCNSMPGLLGKGEWEWYIKDSIKNVIELGVDDELRNAIIDQKLVQHREAISLGY
jgi:hypothetical protein